MAVKFFGQFLVERGVVSREILLNAIHLQDTVNVSFGDVALSMGLMTEKDITKVNQAQRTEDQRFGDMAVKLGIITEAQLQQVLEKQKNTHLYIGEAIVKVGGMSAADLQRYLEEFKADQARYSTDSLVVPPAVPYPHLCAIMADLTKKMLTRVARINYHLEEAKVSEAPISSDIGAMITFTGSATVRYLFSTSLSIRDKIAEAMLGETDVSNETSEVLDDTVMEFVNVVCGNIAAKAAQQDAALEIGPPELIERPEKCTVQPGEVGLSIPISFPDGEHAELFLMVKK